MQDKVERGYSIRESPPGGEVKSVHKTSPPGGELLLVSPCHLVVTSQFNSPISPHPASLLLDLPSNKTEIIVSHYRCLPSLYADLIALRS